MENLSDSNTPRGIASLYRTAVRLLAARLRWQEDTVRQFIRYVVIGVATAALDVGLFAAFSLLPGWSVQACSSCSWLITTCVHFLLNKYWNFRSSERSAAQQACTYLVTALMSYAFMLGCITLLSDVLHLQRILAKLLTSALNLLWSFPAQKFLTFGKGILQTLKQRSRKTH